MYGYYEYSNLTPEQVLQKVSQEQIFSWLLGLPFDINSKYLSPLREDNNPRCWFEQVEGGTILFMDFGRRSAARHLSCFGMLMRIYGVTLSSAIDMICDNFGISKNSNEYLPVQRAIVSEKTESLPTIIKPEYKPFERKDKIFWNQFVISLDQLQEDNVFSTSRFYLSSKKGSRWITPFNICYDINFIDASKIYQPYNHKYKWITNCDENHIGNFDNLPATGERLVIQKSYKDHRVIRNNITDSNVVWFINEGATPLDSILLNLMSRFRIIIIFFDNDMAGIHAAYRLYKKLKSFNTGNVIQIKYIPIKYKYKDVSEFIHREGRSDTIKLLNQIEL